MDRPKDVVWTSGKLLQDQILYTTLVLLLGEVSDNEFAKMLKKPT